MIPLRGSSQNGCGTMYSHLTCPLALPADLSLSGLRSVQFIKPRSFLECGIHTRKGQGGHSEEENRQNKSVLDPRSVDNFVQYVETSDRKQYVLRIYNNGQNTPRVKYEHEVLGQLRKKALSFKIPTTIASIKTGQSSVSLSNGAEASLFELIPGELQKSGREGDLICLISFT